MWAARRDPRRVVFVLLLREEDAAPPVLGGEEGARLAAEVVALHRVAEFVHLAARVHVERAAVRLRGGVVVQREVGRRAAGERVDGLGDGH